MKSFSFLMILSLGGLLFFSACNNKKTVSEAKEVGVIAEAVSYPLDLVNSKLFWLGKKVSGQHNGTVNIASGELMLKNDTLTGGKFEFDMKSIVNLDLTEAKMNEKLTQHLKSADFFNVDSFATATFEITTAEVISKPTDLNNYKISGNLTIKGITNNISFPSVVLVKEGMVNTKATIIIDRTLWNIKYGSGKFFKNLGDKLINDEFEITIDILAKKPETTVNK